MGDYWSGTSDGLNKEILDEKKLLPKKFIHYKRIPGNKSSINGNIITSLLEDNYGRLWIGTDDGGLSTLKRGSDGNFSMDDN